MEGEYQRWMCGGIIVAGIVFFASGLLAEEAVVSQAGEAVASPTQETTVPATVQDNMSVKLEYTLTVEGSVVDSTEGRDPFNYVHGKGQVIPGLERQLAGLHAGDSKEITVNPEEAYGPIDPSAVIEVPKEQLPPNVTPEVGLILRGADPDGRPFRATIREIKDQTVTLDLNHPLAGKTLLFKIKVIDVSPTPAQ